MKRLLLVRHAECEMNLQTKGFVGGQSNLSPLTARGKQQAVALGRHLARLHPSLHSPVFCSTALRAEDTARIMLQQAQGWPGPIQLQASPVLLELSQGDWEGQRRSKCYTPEVLERIAADPFTFAAPGGESQQELEARMSSFVHRQLLPILQYGGPPAVVVTHGLAIKCFLRSVLGSSPAMTWKIETDNTSITELTWVQAGPAAGWHLNRVNDTTHLVLAGLTGKLQEWQQGSNQPTEAGTAAAAAAAMPAACVQREERGPT
ncbi:histidine phosphatase superfamily [Scenedesmus sp. NREL 46B-D3]|nr:histidine phosphatase superfamily [Scenedesmus sp. NREL 46B-D3]